MHDLSIDIIRQKQKKKLQKRAHLFVAQECFGKLAKRMDDWNAA